MLSFVVRLSKKETLKILKTCKTQVAMKSVRKLSVDRCSIKKEPLITQAAVDEFREYFPTIVKELTREKNIKTLQFSVHFEKLLNYTVPTGHCYRGLTTVAAIKIFEEKTSPVHVKLANILGWIVELNESGLVVLDDIVDNTKMRRGALSWYALKNGDSKTINDGIYLHETVFVLLNTYFSKHSCYLPLLQLFLDVQNKTTIGQIIDGQSRKGGRINWEFFTMDVYTLLSILKAGNVVLHLPVASAMYFANIDNPNLHKEAKRILLKMGEYYQIQNDYTDCFENVKVRGFPGNDIREGKLTWLAVSAVQKATSGQRKLLEENYGRDDDEAERNVKNLYKKLGLEEDFCRYKDESYNEIASAIQKSNKVFQKLFFKMLDSLYKYSSY